MIKKTKIIKTLNIDIDTYVLKYTEMFPYNHLVYNIFTSIEDNKEFINFEVDDSINEEIAYDLLENHQSLQGDYSSVQSIIFQNRLKELEYWIQEYLDQKAQERGYDDIKSVRSYTGYTNKFQTECIDIAQWCSDCWDVSIQGMNDIINGTSPIPTQSELIASLPPFPTI